jgi:hypothetical protein
VTFPVRDWIRIAPPEIHLGAGAVDLDLRREWISPRAPLKPSGTTFGCGSDE